MAITFWCAECGTRLEADEADAGREVECGHCEAVVRVPRNPPPPREPEYDDPFYLDERPRREAIPTAEATPARRAFRMLQLSLILCVFGYAFGMLVNGLRVAIDGLDAVLQNKPGNSRPLVIAGGVVGILIFFAGGCLRAVAYRKCLPVGRRIGSDTVLILAGVGAIVYTLGSVLASAPGLFITNPNQVNPSLLLLVYGGGFLFLVGFAFESAVLFFHHRLLGGTSGQTDARRVVSYAITFGVTVVFAIFATCGFWMVFAITLAARGVGQPGGQPQINAANVPDEIWAIGGVIFVFVFLAGALVCWQYYRILAACRDGLAAATRPETELSPERPT